MNTDRFTDWDTSGFFADEDDVMKSTPSLSDVHTPAASTPLARRKKKMKPKPGEVEVTMSLAKQLRLLLKQARHPAGSPGGKGGEFASTIGGKKTTPAQQRNLAIAYSALADARKQKASGNAERTAYAVLRARSALRVARRSSVNLKGPGKDAKPPAPKPAAPKPVPVAPKPAVVAPRPVSVASRPAAPNPAAPKPPTTSGWTGAIPVGEQAVTRVGLYPGLDSPRGSKHTPRGTVVTVVQHKPSKMKGAFPEDNIYVIRTPDGKKHMVSERTVDPHITKADVEVTMSLEKSDEDQRMAWGWASVTTLNGQPLEDLQGDVIETEELQKAVHEFVRKKRVMGEMHTIIGTGDIVDSIVLTKDLQRAMGIDLGKEGWFVGVHVTNDSTWSKVKKGELRGFSLGGFGVRELMKSMGDDEEAVELDLDDLSKRMDFLEAVEDVLEKTSRKPAGSPGGTGGQFTGGPAGFGNTRVKATNLSPKLRESLQGFRGRPIERDKHGGHRSGTQGNKGLSTAGEKMFQSGYKKGEKIYAQMKDKSPKSLDNTMARLGRIRTRLGKPGDQLSHIKSEYITGAIGALSDRRPRRGPRIPMVPYYE